MFFCFFQNSYQLLGQRYNIEDEDDISEKPLNATLVLCLCCNLFMWPVFLCVNDAVVSQTLYKSDLFQTLDGGSSCWASPIHAGFSDLELDQSTHYF